MGLLRSEQGDALYEAHARVASERLGELSIKPQVLVIDNDPRRRAVLGKFLRGQGFQTTVAFVGALGVAAALDPELDMVLLNIAPAGCRGIETLECIRSKSTVPVIMLGGKRSQTACAASLEIGADDFVVRPYSEAELKARLTAVLRRHGRANIRQTRSCMVGKLQLDPSTREVVINAKHVRLTVCQFDLLAALLKSGRSVATKDNLYMIVLGRKRVPFDRSIDNHVSHLRKALRETSGNLIKIETIRGIGYRLAMGD
jgi:DNA-binding response OmpR family regulator